MKPNNYLQLRVNYTSLLNPQTNTFHPHTELVFVVGEVEYGLNEKNQITKANRIADTRIGFDSIDQLKEVHDILGKIIETAGSLQAINEQSNQLLHKSTSCSYSKDGSTPCNAKPVYRCGVCKEHYAELLENEDNN